MNCLCYIFEDNNIWVWILIILVISALSAFPLGDRLGSSLLRSRSKQPVYISVAWYAVLLVLCIAGMMSSTYSSFLYFQF